MLHGRVEGPEQRNQPGTDNEQLEFVGDAVLELVVTEAMFREFPNCTEGELTRLRANLVSRKRMAEMGLELGLGELLKLGKSAELNGGRKKPALLANTAEAVIAAVYLDGGLEAAARLVEREVIAPAQERLGGSTAEQWQDWKSALQEWLQARGQARAEYVLVSEQGPDHRKEFTLELRVGDEALAQATAASKKLAEQECAREGLAKLRGTRA